MHKLKSIRERLGITQQVLAEALECTQGNVGHYERGQDFPTDRAKTLISFARDRGLTLSYDHIYGDAPLPPLATKEASV